MTAPTQLARRLATTSATAVALGATALAYAAAYEVRAFRLREVEVPVLPAGAAPLRVLHLSDIHLVPSQRDKAAWVRDLGRLEPDLVVDTGDNIASADAVPDTLDALEPLLERPGVFVRGSNDYFAPRPKNPARYLLPPSGHRVTGRSLPWRDLRDGMLAAGWVDLDNARATMKLGGLRVDLVGTDDPHIRRDRYADVAAPRDPDADLVLGITHAPYLRVLDAMVSDGADLVLAGHTHGGQLCVPGYGALVTNCDLDRTRVKGLSRHQVGARTLEDVTATGAGDGTAAWLHVSAGLGTSPYAPVRFACPPEATLLTLVAR